MFKRIYLTAILSGALFGIGACERHDWEKTRVLHESHGHGEHQEQDGGGGAGHESEAPDHAEEKTPGNEEKAPEKGGGPEAGNEAGNDAAHVRYVGM